MALCLLRLASAMMSFPGLYVLQPDSPVQLTGNTKHQLDWPLEEMPVLPQSKIEPVLNVKFGGLRAEVFDEIEVAADAFEHLFGEVLDLEVTVRPMFLNDTREIQISNIVVPGKFTAKKFANSLEREALKVCGVYRSVVREIKATASRPNPVANIICDPGATSVQNVSIEMSCRFHEIREPFDDDESKLMMTNKKLRANFLTDHREEILIDTIGFGFPTRDWQTSLCLQRCEYPSTVGLKSQMGKSTVSRSGSIIHHLVCNLAEMLPRNTFMSIRE